MDKEYIAFDSSSNLLVVGFCPIDLLNFSLPVPAMAPRTFTEGDLSEAICPVEVVASDTRQVAQIGKPPASTTFLKQSLSGAKRKREDKLTFECLDVEGSRKNEVGEPELLSGDESSSDDDQDIKMPTLPSSSGTTISTSKDSEHGGGDSEEATLPIFKSYDPDLISPPVGGGHEEVVVGGLSTRLSPVRRMANLDKPGLGTEREVTSSPTKPVPGSHCLPGRKRELNPPAAVSIEPTGLTSSPYFDSFILYQEFLTHSPICFNILFLYSCIYFFVFRDF